MSNRKSKFLDKFRRRRPQTEDHDSSSSSRGKETGRTIASAVTTGIDIAAGAAQNVPIAGPVLKVISEIIGFCRVSTIPLAITKVKYH